MAKQKHFFGEFNRNGYTIYSDDKYEDAVYQAGNCEGDSAQYLPVGADGTIDLATIEEYCNSTGKAMAEESDGIWDGCGQIDDEETE